MQAEILNFYNQIRNIFSVCNSCNNIFRLSDCKIFLKKPYELDWMDKLDSEIYRLEQLEEDLKNKIEIQRVNAREEGRMQADSEISKIDRIFTPNNLNPNDAKVIFHPVDFIVFRGMNKSQDSEIEELVFLDKISNDVERIKFQENISTIVSKGNYDWITLKIKNDGSIEEE